MFLKTKNQPVVANDCLLATNLLDYPLFARGKVRDVYDMGDKLLIVATDRISAFDTVLPTGIPGKGKVLSALSIFWFEFLRDIVGHHLLTADINDCPAGLQKYRDQIAGRFMLVKKAKRLDLECVVRGYIAGSLWKDYQLAKAKAGDGLICLLGLELPATLRESAPFPVPLFTPATKADSGHDENIGFEQVQAMVGHALAEQLRRLSINLYQKAAHYAQQKGIIIADTKFEFGLVNGELILIDEVLTPDSSRFWPAEKYQPGASQESFDKQYVRDYLESIKWNKKPPAPPLPPEVVMNTQKKYLEAYTKLTGQPFCLL